MEKLGSTTDNTQRTNLEAIWFVVVPIAFRDAVTIKPNGNDLFINGSFPFIVNR